MDDRVSFDVYATLKNPHFRVDFAEDVDRIEVKFGGPSFCELPLNALNLWFTDPRTVLDFARELCAAGNQFLAAQEGHFDDAESAVPEGYPVPHKKPEGGKRDDDD